MSRILKADDIAVWFAEGWRSPDGKLQRFLPGIGELLLRSGAPVVPAYAVGAFAALPRERRVPRLHRVAVAFGDPIPVAALRAAGAGRSDEERIASTLRERVADLASESGALVKAAGALP